MKARLFILALAAATITAESASAHHSFSMYDRHRTVTLSGVVKEYVWMAPHVRISVLSQGGRNNQSPGPSRAARRPCSRAAAGPAHC